MRHAFSILLVLVMTAFAIGEPAAAPATRPVAGIERVLIVSIDGLRPDLAVLADTPNLHALLKQGAFTLWARTTAVSITLPSHVSMMTGVSPAKHGVDWNAELPAGRYPYPAVPTLFEVARGHGYTTAMAAGKSKFKALARPGSFDWSFIPELPKITDSEVAKHAADIIAEHHPDVMFVHLPGVDNAGHAKGWASPEQMAAIHVADAALGQVIAAAREAKTLDHTLLIVTADHGGAGMVHGPDDPRSRQIPWIAVGPGVRAAYDLTRAGALTVNTEDTFATACFVLGLPLGDNLDGKPIQAIFDRPAQLLVSSPK